MTELGRLSCTATCTVSPSFPALTHSHSTMSPSAAMKSNIDIVVPFLDLFFLPEDLGIIYFGLYPVCFCQACVMVCNDPHFSSEAAREE